MAAVVVQGVSARMVVLEQEVGVTPSPSPSAVTTHRFAYNFALQNDL